MEESPAVPCICDKGACDPLYSNQSLCIPCQLRAGSPPASASLVLGAQVCMPHRLGLCIFKEVFIQLLRILP